MKNAKSQFSKVKKGVVKIASEKEVRINKLVNSVVFPIIKEISDSVDSAALYPAVLKTVIQQAILNDSMKKTLKDLDLAEQLKGGEGVETAKFLRIIESLENESVADCYNILEGIGEEIALKQRLFWKSKPLTDLYDTKN